MQTLNRAAGIAIVLFFGGLGLMIGVRIEQVTMALLGGVLIGLLVVIPATALVVMLIQRDRSTYASHQKMPLAYYPQQPTYVTPPSARATMPAPPADYDAPFTIATGRRVHIIGAPIGGSTSRPSQLLDNPETF